VALADQFYSSGTFWAASGTLAGIVVGVVSILVIWRQGNPVRSLRYGMSSSALLPGATQKMPGTLEVTWDGAVVQDPHVLELTLISRGRRDIASEDFDNQPLQFNVGARILAVIKTSCTPEPAAFHAFALDGDVLKVGPGLIVRRQTIRFTLLADGPHPALSSPAEALRDVKLGKLSLESPRRHLHSSTRIAISVVAGAVIAAALVLGGFSLRSPSQAGSLQAATADLGSGSLNTRITGIATLRGIIRMSPGDQPAVILLLSAFIRDHSPAGNSDGIVADEIQDALNVLKVRKASDDGGAAIDLAGANLTNASLVGIDLASADLTNADFTDADLANADLKGANLSDAYFGNAIVAGADFAGADLGGASFYQTSLCSGSAPTHRGDGYICSQ
jgi:hypothetical protein